MRPLRTLACLLALGCARSDDEEGVEPLVLPDDPSEAGVPVGVRTFAAGLRQVEVWYPASDATSGPAEVVDFGQAIPASVEALLGPVALPPIETAAVRDAPLRRAERSYPVLVFSHGFGGTRHQSASLTTHLASRGYVVLATDHRGRSFPDLLPCLFSPPAEGCDLSAFGSDRGPADVDAVLEAVSGQAFLEGALDLDRLGILGHSAGGTTTATVVDADPRFLAALPMAGTRAVSRDVPVLDLAGSCDGIVTLDTIEAQSAQSSRAELVVLPGAGHLAFSDLCTLDLGDLAATYLDGRDDLNALLYDGLVQLGTDGCPGAAPTVPGCDAFTPLTEDASVIRGLATAFFDEHL